MLESLLIKYRRAGVLIDTNLLLLYLIGSYDPNYIQDYKRTSKYTIDDFNWLSEYIKKFDRIILTPQILAEVWNLVEKIQKNRFTSFLERSLPQLVYMTENYVEKNSIILNKHFHFIGVTDTSVILAAKVLDCLVLTDDLRSQSHYYLNNIPVININNLRPI